MLYTTLLDTLRTKTEFTPIERCAVANFCFDFDPYGVYDFYGNVIDDLDDRKAYIEGIVKDLYDPEIRQTIIEMLVFTIEKCDENTGSTTFYANEF